VCQQFPVASDNCIQTGESTGETLPFLCNIRVLCLRAAPQQYACRLLPMCGTVLWSQLWRKALPMAP
jgi:hypothetical protein